MSTQQYTCKCCGQLFTARTADRARGWALYCSKRCKAIKQESRTGQYAAYKSRADEGGSSDAYHVEDGSWDAHKGSF